MFQLIAGIIGVLLIALLVIAAVYYGGSLHLESVVRADYAGNVSTASQIQSALELYYNDHATYPPSTLTDNDLLEFLVANGYLKEVPHGNWMVNPGSLARLITNQSVEECSTMNRIAGMNIGVSDLAGAPYHGCPPCRGVEGTAEGVLAERYKDWPICQFSG